MLGYAYDYAAGEGLPGPVVGDFVDGEGGGCPGVARWVCRRLRGRDADEITVLGGSVGMEDRVASRATVVG